MDIINHFFSKLVFTKVEEKTTEQGTRFFVYGAGVKGSLGNGRRYVLLFVPYHLAIQRQAKIHELPWQNLQTRTLGEDAYRLKIQQWTLPRDAPDILLQVIRRNSHHSEYVGYVPNPHGPQYPPLDFPFEILLLHNRKKKTKYQYNDRLMLSTAIDTFNAVFNHTGETGYLQAGTSPAMSASPGVWEHTGAAPDSDYVLL